MNYYTTAIEGLPKMLFEMEKPLESFKRNVYPGEFEKYCERHQAVLEDRERLPDGDRQGAVSD